MNNLVAILDGIGNFSEAETYYAEAEKLLIESKKFTRYANR